MTNRTDKTTNQKNAGKANVSQAASHLIDEGKKYAHELYEEGVHKVNDAQQHAKEYSDELAEKVKKNPLSSILIAAGVGFLLSSLLRK